MDWSNLALLAIIFVSWFFFYLASNLKFQVEPRYYVYDDIEAPVTILNYNRTESNSPDELIKLLQLFDSVEKIALYFQFYSSLTTFSLIILTLRMIKMLHFQPRMGLLT